MTQPSVLVVEDDDATRGLLVSALADDATVVAAVDASQALRTIIAIRPDVIVLDLALAGSGDGADVARSVQARGLRLPRVVVVSGASDARQVAAAMGADAFFAKPFDIEAVTKRVLELGAEPLSGPS